MRHFGIRILLFLLVLGEGAYLPGSLSASEVRFSNGVRCVLAERHTLPFVSIQVLMDAGSRSERSGEEGAAHLLEHLLFKGAGSYRRGELDWALETLGGRLTASTGADSVRLSVTLPAECWKKALPLLREMVSHASLPPEEFEKEKRVVKDELDLRAADLESPLAQMYPVAFAGHPYAHSPGGTSDSLTLLSLESVRRFYERQYRPERCVVSAAGDLQEQDGEQAIRRTFGGWILPEEKRGFSETSVPFTPRSPLPWKLRQGEHILVGFPAPPASSRRLAAVVLMIEALLGDERGGRLASPSLPSPHFSTFYAPRKETSLFLVSGSPSPQNKQSAAVTENRILASVQSLTVRPAATQELTAALQSVLIRLKQEQETAEGLALTCGLAELLEGDRPDELQRQVSTVTGKEIAAFVRHYWSELPSPAFVPEPRRNQNDSSVSFSRVPALQKTASSVLTNGTRLLLTPMPHASNCTISVFIKTEPDADEEEKAVGLLVSRAAFFGSRHRSFESIALSVGRVGGSLEFLKTPNFAAFTLQTRYENIREAVYLLSESLKNADFSQEALDRARLQIEGERKQKKTPRELLKVRFIAEFDGEPTLESLRRVTPQKALLYFRSRYLADQTVISVAGAFVPSVVQRSFDNNLFDFERKSRRPLQQREAVLPPKGTWSEQEAFGGKGSYLGAAVPAPSPESEDAPAFAVMSAILGRGAGSRLFSEIRDQEGIGYEAGAASLFPQANLLLMELAWSAARKDVTKEEMEQKLKAQLDRLMQTSPSQQEITRAKALLIQGDWLRQEKPRDCAISTALSEVIGRSVSKTPFEKALSQVTPEDIQRVSKLYLSSCRSLWLVPQKSP